MSNRGKKTDPGGTTMDEYVLKDNNGRTYAYEMKHKNSKNATGDNSSDNAIACTSLSFDLKDIKETFEKLNDGQREFVMHVYGQYKNNIEQINDNPKIILLGPAGSGKTFVINFLEKLILWDAYKASDSLEKEKVLKCASTHRAANNIAGFTLQSMLSKIPLRDTRSVSNTIINYKKELKENCIFFICDEISTVPETTMKSMNVRLQNIFDNEKLYGGRFVLLVGDLYQLPPAVGKYLYPESILWTCCTFYELTEIKRQECESFIKLLNNFKTTNMTDEEIEALKSRKKELKDVPDSVIHIYYQGKNADEMNDTKLKNSTGEQKTVKSLNPDSWEPTDIRVKIGTRYMFTKNFDLSDDLESGTTGIVKHFDIDENSVVKVIWMEFNSTKIGKKTRTTYLSKLKMPNDEKHPWVPIEHSILFKNGKFVKVFPIKVAEAITIYESQGQTYPGGVCIHIIEGQKDELRTNKLFQYVALTRVQKLEDLYIHGNFDFKGLKKEKASNTQDVFKHLRDNCKLTLLFDTFKDKPDDVIIFLNTESTFKDNYEFIDTDTWYRNGSLLVFTETNTIGSDEVEIKNFEIAFRSDTTNVVRSGEGIICYKKKDKKIVEVTDTMLGNNNKTNLTLLLYENYLYIIICNKGDKNDIDSIKEVVQYVDQNIQNKQCICFIGNLDLNLKPDITNFLKDEKFGITLTCDTLDKYDMIFTRNFNINKNQCGCYEYIPSHHKPIYVKLPPKPESAEYKTITLSPSPSTSQQNNYICTVNELNQHGTTTQREKQPDAETHGQETLRERETRRKTSLSAPEPHGDNTRNKPDVTKSNRQDYPQKRGKRAGFYHKMSLAQNIKPNTSEPQPGPSGLGATKRGRPDDTVSPSTLQGNPKRVKTQSAQIEQRTYERATKDIPAQLAVTICPIRDITTQEAEHIQLSLEDLVMDADPCNPLPAFRGDPRVAEGTVQMWCEDDNALTWLTQNVPNIKLPNSDATLIVMRQSDVPTRVRAALFVPRYRGAVVRLLSILIRQNTWYDISSWSMDKATTVGGENYGTFLTLGIPLDEVEKINARERRVACLLGSIYIRFFPTPQPSDTQNMTPHNNASTQATPTDDLQMKELEEERRARAAMAVSDGGSAPLASPGWTEQLLASSPSDDRMGLEEGGELSNGSISS